MNITIRSTDNVIFSGIAQQITLPGLYGSIGVLPHHAPMSVILTKGKVCLITNENDKKSFDIEIGIAKIANNSVNILLQ